MILINNEMMFSKIGILTNNFLFHKMIANL